jgi:hypothetical protein
MKRAAYCAIALLSLLRPLIPSPAQAQVSVTMHHNDVGRTGQNLNETILNTSNVSVNQFGKLFACQVDGYVYAQPLYVAQVTISSALHNVVYVATENNSVYAFDADHGAQLWHVNLGTPVPSTDISSTYKDLTPVIGITGTPVIDPVSSTIYLVAKTKNTSNNTYHQNLHALDITSGAEKPGSPVEITASVPGSGSGSSGGTIAFQPLYQLNRPGLLLLNGVMYIAFGSHGDIGPYHGWVLGYNASTLAQLAVFNTTPNGSEAAVWQGGQGLVADADNIYFMTGNGTFDANTGGTDYGDSVVKLATSTGLSVSDYFTPDTQGSLNQTDADLGSGGPILLPGTSSIVGGGKDGILRLINTASMGAFNAAFNGDQQEFQATSGKIMIGPIYWNSPNHGPVLYLWGPGDYLKVFEFLNGSFQTAAVSQSTMTSPAGNSNAAGFVTVRQREHIGQRNCLGVRLLLGRFQSANGAGDPAGLRRDEPEHGTVEQQAEHCARRCRQLRKICTADDRERQSVSGHFLQSTAGLRPAAAGSPVGELGLADLGTNFGWNERDDRGNGISVRGRGEFRGK